MEKTSRMVILAAIPLSTALLLGAAAPAFAAETPETITTRIFPTETILNTPNEAQPFPAIYYKTHLDIANVLKNKGKDTSNLSYELEDSKLGTIDSNGVYAPSKSILPATKGNTKTVKINCKQGGKAKYTVKVIAREPNFVLFNDTTSIDIDKYVKASTKEKYKDLIFKATDGTLEKGTLKNTTFVPAKSGSYYFKVYPKDKPKTLVEMICVYGVPWMAQDGQYTAPNLNGNNKVTSYKLVNGAADTEKAFQKAADNGAYMMQAKVFFTKDNKIVCSASAKVKNKKGKEVSISKAKYEDIKSNVTTFDKFLDICRAGHVYPRIMMRPTSNLTNKSQAEKLVNTITDKMGGDPFVNNYLITFVSTTKASDNEKLSKQAELLYAAANKTWQKDMFRFLTTSNMKGNGGMWDIRDKAGKEYAANQQSSNSSVDMDYYQVSDYRKQLFDGAATLNSTSIPVKGNDMVGAIHTPNSKDQAVLKYGTNQTTVNKEKSAAKNSSSSSSSKSSSSSSNVPTWGGNK